jgi:hypothetical protein
MPRASGIWVISKGSFILGAFTVKHEFVDWLKKNVDKYGWQSYEIHITKFIDSNPQIPAKYFRIEDFLNG